MNLFILFKKLKYKIMSKTSLKLPFSIFACFDKILLDSLNELKCSLFLYFLVQLLNYVYDLVFSLWEGFQQFINSLVFMQSFYFFHFFFFEPALVTYYPKTVPI